MDKGFNVSNRPGWSKSRHVFLFSSPYLTHDPTPLLGTETDGDSIRKSESSRAVRTVRERASLLVRSRRLFRALARNNESGEEMGRWAGRAKAFAAYGRIFAHTFARV